MKIYLGSDHAGLELKDKLAEFLKQNGHQAEDLGPSTYDAEDDYPDYAVKVCEKVLGENAYGILLCGTGQGMDRVANKFPGIDAALCWDELTAKVAREHGDTNILCIGSKTITEDLAKKIVQIWLTESFSNKERHKRRIAKIRDIESRYLKK
mgnify:CR=1 FL=1